MFPGWHLATGEWECFLLVVFPLPRCSKGTCFFALFLLSLLRFIELFCMVARWFPRPTRLNWSDRWHFDRHFWSDWLGEGRRGHIVWISLRGYRFPSLDWFSRPLIAGSWSLPNSCSMPFFTFRAFFATLVHPCPARCICKHILSKCRFVALAWIGMFLTLLTIGIIFIDSPWITSSVPVTDLCKQFTSFPPWLTMILQLFKANNDSFTTPLMLAERCIMYSPHNRISANFRHIPWNIIWTFATVSWKTAW